MRKPKVIEAAADKTAAPEPPAAGHKRGRGGQRSSEFDVALGTRIRLARVAARMSQTVLGQAVGISFQQVQKYEIGKDRVSASTLQGLADALGVHPGSLYDDSPMPVGGSPDLRAAMQSAEVLQQIHNPRVLKQLLVLAKVLAEEMSASTDAPETAKIDGHREPVP